MTRKEIAILLALPLIVTAFSIWEALGLTPGIDWHTISYWSQHNLWLAIAIGVGAFLAVVVFEVWWVRHMHSRIDKLHRGVPDVTDRKVEIHWRGYVIWIDRELFNEDSLNLSRLLRPKLERIERQTQ